MNDSHHSTFRILDAAINRASEGVRVVEDYTRMVLCDSHLSMRLKELRHSLVTLTEPLDREKRIFSRDSETDVGRKLSTNTEYERPNESGVVQANMSRVTQALRTIEEFAKPLNVEVSKGVEQLRYESYTLEKAILTTMMSSARLSGCQLYVLMTGMGGAEQLEKAAAGLIESGVDLIQLRDKSLGDRELVAAGRVLTTVTRGTDAKWIMNDRCDLAMAAGADGVHLGQTDLSVSDARRVVGPAKLIGLSTHSLEQAKEAVVAGANYIGVGPVFQTATKSFEESKWVGPELVKKVVEEIALPVFAIGGIDATNLSELLAVGCQRIAVSSAVSGAADCFAAARELKSRLGEVVS